MLTGNTCLAGDVMGEYAFDKKLKIGDKIVFLDQIHYTIVLAQSGSYAMSQANASFLRSLAKVK